MSRKIEIVACSPLVLFLTVFLTSAAQAKQIPIEWRFAASAVISFPEEGAFLRAEVIAHSKGSGGGTIRTVVLYGPPGPPSSELCEGFAAELPLLTGSTVWTAADLSQLHVLITSGMTCTTGVGGVSTGVYEGTVVGGSGRFEGASGTLHSEDHSMDVDPFEIMNAGTGTITGTITVP